MNKTQLFARGWTPRRIEVFLGSPDGTYFKKTRFTNSVTGNIPNWDDRRVFSAEKAGALEKPLPKKPETVSLINI